MQVKAIETRYQGCRFRSRLEARWAVFFDSLGIYWEYEKEGFQLPSGRYLPDFYVPCAGRVEDLVCWVEIKPKSPSVREKQLLSELVQQTGECGYFFCGNPWHNGHEVYLLSRGTDGVVHETCGRIIQECWAESPFYGMIMLKERDGDRDYFVSIKSFNQGRLEEAFTAARSARFEFGESGSR